ncbi:hypothetical protein Anapl_02811 [Anas platyrhynchos]|uniref:Uncharacterized protein n=1 Tax=Anas platyrhynchos TaxID=8839 RepID=R0LVV3_ANAPL|nr:hypothetical protein Anapl_02811 [Anas platyrhynchos]
MEDSVRKTSGNSIHALNSNYTPSSKDTCFDLPRTLSGLKPKEVGAEVNVKYILCHVYCGQVSPSPKRDFPSTSSSSARFFPDVFPSKPCSHPSLSPPFTSDLASPAIRGSLTFWDWGEGMGQPGPGKRALVLLQDVEWWHHRTKGGHTAPPDTRRLPTGVLLPDALQLASSASSGKEKKGFSESFSEAFSSSK